MMSLGQKLKQLEGLLGTNETPPRNQDFIRRALEQTEQGKKTSRLTGKQVEYLESLWKQHYGY